MTRCCSTTTWMSPSVKAGGAMKKFLFIALLTAMLAPVAGAHADPVIVGTDPAGDWGVNAAGDNSLAPIGDALGADLTSAAVDNPATGALRFVIGLNGLPATGGTPEAIRYVWAMRVGGKHVE